MVGRVDHGTNCQNGGSLCENVTQHRRVMSSAIWVSQATHTHTYTHPDIYTHRYTHTQTYRHTHIHTYTHTYITTHIHTAVTAESLAMKPKDTLII